MPAKAAATHKHKAGATSTPSAVTAQAEGGAVQNIQEEANKVTRLHITPFTPALLKAYLAPSVQSLAQNISYHTVETFPDKGFGYVELPAMEAQKLKKKLNGSTLKGSKVRIEDAKPEKRKAAEDDGTVNEHQERPSKRTKKTKAKKEQGVLDGAELPSDRKVKRGWTEPPVKGNKGKKEKKIKDKDKKGKRKESKYTKEPEVLFKAALTPVAATEAASKEKSKTKKKNGKNSKSKVEVVVHEFEKNSKQPSFLKAPKVTAEKKPAVEYIDGQGWVDEDGNVVEAETGKARNRRVLELVDSGPAQPTTEKQTSTTPSPKSSPAPKSTKGKKSKKAITPPSSSESEAEESSVVSSSSEDETSESGEEVESGAEASPLSSAPAPKGTTPEIALTPSSPSKKEVHPLEALFKRPRPTSLSNLGSNTASTPAKGLAPINTSFSFFDNNGDAPEVAEGGPEHLPITPFTQRDLDWRGLRSAAPTPDTAAIGRRFSFPWRNSSQEADDADEDQDPEAQHQLSNNTKANAAATHLAGVAEEDEEEDAEGGGEQDVEDEDVEEKEDEEKPESEFKKWFWENQGNLNRAWKKRRRDALKSKRLTENKRAVGGRRTG